MRKAAFWLVTLLCLSLSSALAQGAVRGVVVSEVANVRIVPALGADVVANVPGGWDFVATGRSPDNEWLRIDFNGDEGWLHISTLVILEGDINALTVADPRTIPYGGFESPRAGMSNATSAITGKLSSKRLDLTPFAAGETKADKAGKSAPEAQQDKAESQYVFVEEPLPLEALNKTDVDIDADIGRLTFDKIVLLDVATALELKDGNLHFKNRFAEPGGGTSVSDIVLTTAGGSAELGVDVNMRDLHLNLLSGDIKDKSLVPPIGVTLDLKSRGGTPRALASSTNGRVLLTAGKGQIENNLLATVSGDVFAKLFSALNPFSKTDPFTTTDCTIVALNISDGMADIAGLYSQGDKVKVVGGGDIDLNTEALNIEFNTKPRKGVGVSADMFVTPFVKLKGTLANPSVGLDKKGALLAVGTGGLSVLAQAAADRIAGEKDNCAKVLEEVGDHPPVKN